MKKLLIISLVLITLLTSSCSKSTMNNSKKSDYPDSEPVKRDEVLFNRFDSEKVDGVDVYLDFSGLDEGYFGVSLKDGIEKRVKLRVIKDDVTYTYDVLTKDMTAIPLQMGNGEYLIKVFEQVEGTTYVLLYGQTLDLDLEDEKIVYLYPNQIVNYNENSKVVDESFNTVKDDKNDLDRIYHLFTYVLDTITYDHEKAELIKDIYILPDLDEAVTTGKGICFDYASLLCALCRIQHIPSRVIVGYTDIDYHAWCEIYLENEGWINPRLYFNSSSWSLVDPTFADSGKDYEGKYDEVYKY